MQSYGAIARYLLMACFYYANTFNVTGYNVVCETPLVAHTSPIVLHA